MHAWMEFCAALTYDDFASIHDLTTITLNTKIFGVRITTITCTTASFFMCHCKAPSLSLDLCNFYFGVVLSVTLPFFMVFTTTELHDMNFLMTTLRNYRCRY